MNASSTPYSLPIVTVEEWYIPGHWQVRVRWPEGLVLAGAPSDDEATANAAAEQVRKALTPPSEVDAERLRSHRLRSELWLLLGRSDGFGMDVELIDAVGDLADHRGRLLAENERLRAALAAASGDQRPGPATT